MWGVCRGAKPLCRESEGVPQIGISTPFLVRKGARGMVGRVVQHPAKDLAARRDVDRGSPQSVRTESVVGGSHLPSR